MAQDYNVQLESLQRLKAVLLSTIEEIHNLRRNYSSFIDSSRQIGLPIQMYQKFRKDYVERKDFALSTIADNIDSIDILWVDKLIEGTEEAIDIASSASVSASGFSSDTGRSANGMSKAERLRILRKGAERLKEAVEREETKKLLIKKAVTDSGREERQRDIHADFVAAILQQQKSR